VRSALTWVHVANICAISYLSDILKTIGITTPAQIAGINGGLAIWNCEH
jgi:hypothetical protein